LKRRTSRRQGRQDVAAAELSGEIEDGIRLAPFTGEATVRSKERCGFW